MRGVGFNRLAERELTEAILYYEEQSKGLGERFLDEVELGIAFLQRYPEAAPKIQGSVRRFALPKFPYALLYRSLPGKIRILAVAHQSRQPQYRVGRR